MIKRISAGLLLCVVSSACEAATVVVDQHNIAFDKSELTVAKGDIVTFNNSDNTSHNIMISGDGVSLNGGLQQPGQGFSAPFVKSGTFQVSCAIHPKMKLTIHVP